jgi:2-C-methyl-D-erythritol 4-phosphate cytidylyltransferase
MMAATNQPLWCVVAAAGQGARFGGACAKQYQPLDGRTVLACTLDRLAACGAVGGLIVVLRHDDALWPGVEHLHGKPVLRCDGGAERVHSVLAGARVARAQGLEREWLLVHDGARPCVREADIQRLIVQGRAHAVGALLGVPLRDTVKRVGDSGEVQESVARQGLWRVQTPQMFRCAELIAALESAIDAAPDQSSLVTDEASAFERLGRFARVVQGSEDNIKVTEPGDLALAELILARQRANLA